MLLEKKNYHIVIFGASGSGKSLIGEMVAEKLKVEFIEGDDLHPEANVTKMKNGNPLTDADRMPWLRTIEQLMAEKINDKKEFVLSCSALKVAYRDLLRQAGNIIFVFLDTSEDILRKRMKNREGHFMPASLLGSQLSTLERPQANEKDVITVDSSKKPQDITNEILARICN